MTRRRGLAPAALLLATVAFAGPSRAAEPPARVRGLSASADSGTVEVSGWVTFSGAVLAGVNDRAGDAAAGGQASGGDLVRVELVYRPELADLFVRMQVTSIPRLDGGIVGDPSLLYGLRTVIAGVPIDIRAQSTGTAAQFGLFSCASENGCLPIATLAGGYGTSGVEITAALPLSVLADAKIPLKEGDRISAPIAYTARAPFAAGVVNDTQKVDAVVTTTKPNIQIATRSVRVTAGSVTRGASLKNGAFSVAFSRSEIGRGRRPVRTRACLGSACAIQSFTVTV